MAESVVTNVTVEPTLGQLAQDYAQLVVRDRAFIRVAGWLKSAGDFLEEHGVTEEGKVWLAQRATLRMEKVIGDIVSRKLAEMKSS